MKFYNKISTGERWEEDATDRAEADGVKEEGGGEGQEKGADEGGEAHAEGEETGEGGQGK